MKNNAFISLGSNMGNRTEFLKEAINRLDQHEKIKLVNISSVYETDPVGYEEQALFLNMVVEILTDLDCHSLLEVCQCIEKELGRKRLVRWGPRTIDLDILFYNQENIESEKLLIPHPRIEERAFVIIPLLEIAPFVKMPNKSMLLRESLKFLQDKEGVRLWRQKKNGEDVFELFEN